MKKNSRTALLDASLSRRSVVKGGAIGGLAAASGALSLPFVRQTQAAPAQNKSR
ncbi:twin-arginine translocation signal domain-containing protein [Edwardsiella ictaluri]|uniref:twin-arginine translocation signal domain-containing protein n=1 Tax=Edwardsiella ictaluri TaxID=67780 RepID=UPI0036D3169C